MATTNETQTSDPRGSVCERSLRRYRMGRVDFAAGQYVRQAPAEPPTDWLAGLANALRGLK